MGDVSGTDPQVLRDFAEMWLYDGDTDQALVGYYLVLDAADELTAARQALAAIAGDIAYVESTYKICEPDPLSDWSAGVTWMIDRLSALLSGVLGEAQQDRSSNDGN